MFGGFDYRRSAEENRKRNAGIEKFGTMIGWPEMQKGSFAIVFGTIFLAPPGHSSKENVDKKTTYTTAEAFHEAVKANLNFYEKLQDANPEMFRLIQTSGEVRDMVRTWMDHPASYPTETNPTGIVRLLEGAEGLRSFEDLDDYWERGLRIIGPVWAGGRWCAGTLSTVPDVLSDEGKTLLQKMEQIGYILDISHMKNHSAMEALEMYQGAVIASHANCFDLIPNLPYERHLKDETIQMLVDHDGVMGVIGFNAFLNADWEKRELPRSVVTLDTLADHIDHICQIAGNSEHAAIGSDADGGFGFPDIPEELNDISDYQKLDRVLLRRGFAEADIDNIFYKNWARVLERALP